MHRDKRFVFYPTRRPQRGDVNLKIQYFGRCMGLFGLRDKDQSCYRLFIELVKSARDGDPISSQELAYKLDLTRGTVVHHLNHLMNAGIVKVSENRYSLKESSLKLVIKSVKLELDEAMENLKQVALELDTELGLD
jgi:predicted transcriptional regulator